MYFVYLQTLETHLNGKHGALGVIVQVLVTKEFNIVSVTAQEQFLGCHLIVILEMDISQKISFVILDLVHQVSAPIFIIGLQE